MSHGMTIAVILLVCAGIFFGSLAQARAVMRRKPDNRGSLLEAKKNTLRGDIAALALGIKQVQGYIDALKATQVKGKDKEPAAFDADLKVAAEAQASLDRAAALKQQTEDGLDKANTDNAVQICSVRLDQARLHIRLARNAVLNHTGVDEDDDTNN